MSSEPIRTAPFYPKNPVLCDFILQTALERKYGQIEPLAPLEDTLELNANEYMKQRLSK